MIWLSFMFVAVFSEKIEGSPTCWKHVNNAFGNKRNCLADKILNQLKIVGFPAGSQTGAATSYSLTTQCPEEGCNQLTDMRTPYHPASRDGYHVRYYTQAHLELSLNHYWIRKNGTKQNDGPYVLLFSSFEEKTGVRFLYKKPIRAVPGIRKNGTYDGEMGLLQKGLADVSSNAYYMTPDRFEFADYTVPISGTPFCIVVRNAPLLPLAEVLLLPYEPSVWIAIVSILVSFSLVWYAVNYIPTISNIQKPLKLSTQIMDVLRIATTGMCVRRLENDSQRLILASLLIFTLVLSSAYQGKLLGFLTSPPHLPEIRTLKKVSEVLSKIYTYSFQEDIMEDKDAPLELRRIREKMVLFKPGDVVRVLRIALQNEDVGVSAALYRFPYYSHLANLTINGQSAFHLVPECINAPGFIGFLIRKGSSLTDKFGSFVMKVIESGLFQHWTQVQRHQMNANGVTIPSLKSTKKNPTPLNLQQMSGSFLLLTSGLGIALIVFCSECIVKYSDIIYNPCR